MNTNPQNYTEFWDFYVQEHSLPVTRLLHFTGTSLGILLLAWFIWRGQWYFFPLSFVTGYGFAWAAHFFVERNKPASFKYPFWSFISDYKMMWFMIVGRMDREVEIAIRNLTRRETDSRMKIAGLPNDTMETKFDK